MLTTTLLAMLSAAPDAGVTAQVALVWGGGKDAGAAKTWRARWDEEQSVAPFITLADGFPKLVASTEVPGMNPGFHVVLLGFCETKEHADVRAWLKALYPFIYEKPVEAGASSCPKWQDGEERIIDVFGGVKKGVTLAAARRVKELYEGEDTTHLIRVVARDKSGTLLDSARYDDHSRAAGDVCDTGVTRLKTGAVRLDRTCTEHVGAYCNRYPGTLERYTVQLTDGKFTVDSKTLKTWDINMNRECAE